MEGISDTAWRFEAMMLLKFLIFLDTWGEKRSFIQTFGKNVPSFIFLPSQSHKGIEDREQGISN